MSVGRLSLAFLIVSTLAPDLSFKYRPRLLAFAKNTIILTTLARDIQCESLSRMCQSVIRCNRYPDMCQSVIRCNRYPDCNLKPYKEEYKGVLR